MKKLTLPTILCLITLSFFSCSTENDDVTNETTTANEILFQAKSLTVTDLDKAKQLYIDMMGTQEYADFKNSIKNFNDKLGAANDVNFETKREWMDWINNNIANTSFTSVTQFETIFDDSINKSDAMVNANPTLFNYVKDADRGQILIIFTPEEGDGNLPDNGYTPSSCLDDCIEEYETAYAAATEQYYDTVEQGTNGTFLGSVSIFFGLRNYEHTINEVLPLNYNNCAGKC